MTWTPPATPQDDAADASRFLARLGYVVLALAAPSGVVLHPLALYVLFPIGVALISFAALLDPPANLGARLRAAFVNPATLIGLAGLGWATLSVLWTPYSVAAGQQLLKIGLWGLAVLLALILPREHARATDLYLFPIGLVLAMLTIFIAWIAARHGAPIEYDRIKDGGTVLATLLFPAMGGLAARGRNGYARLLLIMGFVYAFSIGYSPMMIALFVGFAALSFAVSDLERTTRDLSWLAGGLILLAPLVVLVAAPLARLMLNAKLPGQPDPYPELATAFDAVIHGKLRLVTGHGFETIARGLRAETLPTTTPRSLLFQIWYELGVVGAMLASAGAWFGFRAMAEAPPRLAPYLTAAFACNLALATIDIDLGDMIWFTTLAVALIASDIAARSQYRTTRPSVSHLAHF